MIINRGVKVVCYGKKKIHVSYVTVKVSNRGVKVVCMLK